MKGYLTKPELEHFIDWYIKKYNTKIVKCMYLANNYMKNVKNITPKELTKIHISPELRLDRQYLAEDFLAICKKRKYKKQGNSYLVK